VNWKGCRRCWKNAASKAPGSECRSGAGQSDREYPQEAGADRMLSQCIFNLKITAVDKSNRVSVFR
jgi:hypothetical protein